jgi:hypothetical protein
MMIEMDDTPRDVAILLQRTVDMAPTPVPPDDVVHFARLRSFRIMFQVQRKFFGTELEACRGILRMWAARSFSFLNKSREDDDLEIWLLERNITIAQSFLVWSVGREYDLMMRSQPSTKLIMWRENIELALGGLIYRLHEDVELNDRVIKANRLLENQLNGFMEDQTCSFNSATEKTYAPNRRP